MSMTEKVVVSKRSGRQYVEYDMEEQSDEYQEKRTARHDEAGSEVRDWQGVATTATNSSQSSLEPSPMVRPADGLQEVDTLVLGVQARQRSDSGPFRDAFHPPTASQKLAYSMPELEKSLPVEGRPVNFGIVVPGVYRSSFPQSEDYAFIEALKLKTIVYVFPRAGSRDIC
jgi:tyrosine-protein phosphatase SIW14